jgi:hypothetical protein
MSRGIIERLSKEQKNAAKILSLDEARYLVDSYYQMQENRIRTNAQLREMKKDGEPNGVLHWLSHQNATLEAQIKVALDKFSMTHPIAKWCREQQGIGPVIASGLIAHIDIKKAPTAGHIWSFAGLDPTAEWKKGEKRPWNATLKTLCWKMGESFVKVSGKEDAIYGHLYLERKKLETEKNERGEYADQAKAKLIKYKIGKDTEAYKYYSQGKLPPAHLHARAKRYAVKMFLSHLHHVWYVQHFGVEPVKPFAIAILGHAHYIKPINY